MDALLRAVQLPLYRHIVSIASDEALAEDVLQSTLWTIARKLGQLRDPTVFRAWSYRVATRLAVRAARQEAEWRRALRDDELAQVVDGSGDARAEFDVDIEELARLLAGVSPASAIAVRMYYVDDLSYAEIAEALDLPLGTVKSRIAYGLETLRRQAMRTRQPN
jgi:RNA polymerase sigma-70 factor (ECF subfamily)